MPIMHLGGEHVNRLFVTAAVCLLVAACHHRSGDDEARARNAMFSPGIIEADVGAHAQVLASNAFEGRAPGTRGEQLTTDYLIRQFQRVGLQPGNNGSWLQTVPYVKAVVQNSAAVKLDIDGGKSRAQLAFGTDMVAVSLANQPHAEVRDSPIVFVGYGLDEPEQQRDDFAGLDMRGRTVVMLVNETGWRAQDPMLFKGRKLTWFGHKLVDAARHGAVAAFIVHDTDAVGFPWSAMRNNWSGAHFSLPPEEDRRARLPVAGWLTTEAARKLFAAAGADFNALEKSADLPAFRPVELDAKASIAFDSTISKGVSHNVIAELVGTKRPYQAVIYSAHWDHLGRDGKRIFHGAVDNASSVGGLLEIAEAFSHRRPRPERSVMFMTFTMEESGLLGSRYYVSHPVVPLDLTVADINTDALTVIGPSRDIAVIGYGQSDLDDDLAEVARRQHRVLTPDQLPDKGFFARSGQFNFAAAGVPVLYARSGLDLRDGGVPAGRKAYDDYIANRYHQPADVYDPEWDLRGLVQDLRLLYMVGSKLSMDTSFPQWKPGSDFRRPGEEAK
jgi:Zn-dependent M28 family amino/carboxypeptidase